MYMSQTGPGDGISRSDRVVDGSLWRSNTGDKDESLKLEVGGEAEEVASLKVQSGKALAVFEELKGPGS